MEDQPPPDFDELPPGHLVIQHGILDFIAASWVPLQAPIDRMVALTRLKPLRPLAVHVHRYHVGWVSKPEGPTHLITVPEVHGRGPTDQPEVTKLYVLPPCTKSRRAYTTDEINSSIIQLLGEMSADDAFIFAPVEVFLWLATLAQESGKWLSPSSLSRIQ